MWKDYSGKGAMHNSKTPHDSKFRKFSIISEWALNPPKTRLGTSPVMSSRGYMSLKSEFIQIESIIEKRLFFFVYAKHIYLISTADI